MIVLAHACSGKAPQVTSQQVKEQIDSLGKEGKLARESNDFEKAIELHTMQLRIAEEAGDSIEMAQAYNQIGTNYRRLGILDEASRYHFRAMSASLGAKDTSKVALKVWVNALNGLGNIYMALGNYDQADSVLRLSLEHDRELGSLLGQAINLSNLGSIKERTGQTDSAWIYYRHSLAMNRQAKSELGIALCYTHFASLHEAEHNYEEAIQEYQNAYDMMKNSPDDYHRLEAVINIARLYIETGQTAKALERLKTAEETALRINSLQHQSNVYKLYYQYYEKTGDTRKALDSYIKCNQLQDSLVDVNKFNEIQTMRVNLERQDRQVELEQAHERYLKERAIKNVLLVISIISVLAALSLFYLLQRQCRRDNCLANKKHDTTIYTS